MGRPKPYLRPETGGEAGLRCCKGLNMGDAGSPASYDRAGLKPGSTRPAALLPPIPSMSCDGVTGTHLKKVKKIRRGAYEQFRHNVYFSPAIERSRCPFTFLFYQIN